MLGLIVGSGNITVFSFAVFLKPVAAELDVGRGLLASGLFFANLICGFGTPFVGALADHLGSRVILLLGIPAFALSTASLALLDSNPMTIYILFGLVGTFGAFQNTVLYARVVAGWFDRDRGLALGIAMAGIGIGIIVIPQIAYFLIQAQGWRTAYFGLGAAIMLFAFLPVMSFIRDPRRDERPSPTAQRGVPPGLTLGQAFTNWRFWLLCFVFLIGVITINGALAHLIAMLTDFGVTSHYSLAALSVAGVCVIAGRIFCGWCLDRVTGRYVGVIFFLIPALGMALLTANDIVLMPLGAALCGIGLGAHVGLMAFLATRYFGLRAYGSIFGVMFGVFLVGSGTGPVINGLAFDFFGSYQSSLMWFSVSLLFASMLFLPIGPYQFEAPTPVNEEATR
jgi:MFS family permease